MVGALRVTRAPGRLRPLPLGVRTARDETVNALIGPQHLVLVRHGESRGNVADRDAHERGLERLDLEARDADMPLSDLGLRQAATLGEHLRSLPAGERPDVVFTSPYQRALATAEGAVGADGSGGTALGVELLRDERLRERELGALDGFTRRGIEASFPEEARRRAWLGKFSYRPPSGESWADVVLRVRSFLLELSIQPHPPSRVWVVSHQAVILAFRVALEGLSEKEILDIDAATPIPNCSLTTYACDRDGRWRLTGFADDTVVADVVATAETPAPDRVADRMSDRVSDHA